jgi:23S rRNA pseudouridine1911/1915/1917 synthase
LRRFAQASYGHHMPPVEFAPADLAARIRNEVTMRRRQDDAHRIMEFTVGRRYGHGWTVVDYIHALWPRYVPELGTRWCAQGCVTIDGVPATADARMAPGMCVVLAVPLPPLASGEPALPLELLHQDEHLAVIHKPAGQLAHQAGRQLTGTILDRLQAWYVGRGGRREDVRLVNRIDRDTSGLLLASFNLPAHVHLSRQVSERRIGKEYLALCHGVPDPAHGHWREALGPLPGSIARGVLPDGQDAHTEYRVTEVAPGGGAASLHIDLHTGRQHQIRVHAAHHGHPLIGDWVYGAPCAELAGQALHAHALAFNHPVSETALRVVAPLPPDLAQLWQRLATGWLPTRTALDAEQRSRLGLA